LTEDAVCTGKSAAGGLGPEKLAGYGGLNVGAVLNEVR
jgi:hypothetical protein